MDKKFIAYISAPFIIFFFLTAAASRISFKSALSPAEQKFLSFSFESPHVVLRQSVTAAPVESPLEIKTAAKKEFPKTPLSKLAPQPGAGEEKKLSFILIKNGRKMAILNGIVVKEGDTIDQSRIKRIESDRILMATGKDEKWIKIE